MPGEPEDDTKALPAAVLETATRGAESVAHTVGSGLKSAARAAGAALQSLGETPESIEARETAERLQQEAIETLAEANANLRAKTEAADTPKPAPSRKTPAAKKPGSTRSKVRSTA